MLFLSLMPDKGCMANYGGVKGTGAPNSKEEMGFVCSLRADVQHTLLPAAVGFLYHSNNQLCCGNWFKWIFLIL